MRKNSFLIFLSIFVIFLVGIVLGFFSKEEPGPSEGCCLPPVEATGEFEKNFSQPIFNGKIVNFPVENLLSLDQFWPEQEGVLGFNTEEKWIEVDLSEQKLYAHNGKKIDYEFLISSGKWAPTPKGEFRIWVKLKYTKMEGGIKGTSTYYYLPNVPYTQYFYKGYGLHGTYWHNNFGQPMSYGCINLSIPDAEKLFYWTSPIIIRNQKVVYASKSNPGTRVVIHD